VMSVIRIKINKNIHGYIHGMAKSDIHTWIYPWISISTATLVNASHDEHPLISSRSRQITDERLNSHDVKTTRGRRRRRRCRRHSHSPLHQEGCATAVLHPAYLPPTLLARSNGFEGELASRLLRLQLFIPPFFAAQQRQHMDDSRT